MDVVSQVYFENVPDGNYSVVGRHRNHLDIMTPGSLPMNGTMAYLHGFFTGSAYGIFSIGNVQNSMGSDPESDWS